MAFRRTCARKRRGEAITGLRRNRRLAAVAGSGSASLETQRHSAARLSHASRAVGIVSVNRNGQRQAIMVERDLAVFSRSQATAVLLPRLITAVTISLARWVRIRPRPERPRVRQDTAAGITMAPVQAAPHQVSAGWVRRTVCHRCHTTAHQPLHTTVHQPLHTTAHQPLHTTAHQLLRITTAHQLLRITVRPEEEVAVRLTAGILLRAAIAAAEGHDPSLSRFGSTDRAGAALFFGAGLRGASYSCEAN
jgi:hypothetical protein